MRVNKELNPVAIQHMALNALEARDRSGSNKPLATSDTARNASGDISASGNAAPPSGKLLPAREAAAEHATGLQRAIEMLRENAQKSPEARGLQQALEMLQRNAERSVMVDTEA